MKKNLSIMLAAILAVSLFTGCGAKDEVTPTPTPTPTSTSANDEVTAAPGNTDVENVERVSLREYPVTDYVTLGDYKNIQVTMESTEVTQEEWDALNAQVYNDLVTLENGGITDRAVENGDWVNIDYSGKKDGVAFDGGTAAAQQLEIGSGSFIAGFEEGLVGVMPGETVDLNLTFPEAYHSADLAGQAVVFTVTLNFIYPTEENWSDDVVAAAGNEDYNSIETMKQFVYDYIKDYKEYYYDINLENAVVEAFMKQCQYTGTPEDLIQSYKNDFTLTMTNEATMYGMDVNSLCNYYYGMDLQTFLNVYVEESVRQSLAFQAVANAENLNLSDEVFEERLLEIALSAGCTTIEQYIGENPKEGYRELFMLEDVVAFLMENATVNTLE